MSDPDTQPNAGPAVADLAELVARLANTVADLADQVEREHPNRMAYRNATGSPFETLRGSARKLAWQAESMAAAAKRPKGP